MGSTNVNQGCEQQGRTEFDNDVKIRAMKALSGVHGSVKRSLDGVAQSLCSAGVVSSMDEGRRLAPLLSGREFVYEGAGFFHRSRLVSVDRNPDGRGGYEYEIVDVPNNMYNADTF